MRRFGTTRMAEVITSTRNPLVRELRTLHRRKERDLSGRYLVEGIRTVETALQAGAPLEKIIYIPDLLEDPRGRRLLALAHGRGIPLIRVSERVLDVIADTKTPSGVVAVARVERPDFRRVVGSASTLVIADRIQDPGNLGTIIRIADAAGIAGVLVTPGSVDPYNPKTVRASAGSLFHVPVVDLGEEEEGEAVALLQGRGVRVLVADAHGERVYSEVDYSPPVAVVLGNEAAGVSSLWRSVALTTVRIPIFGKAESLNVASAAAILLYEFARRFPPPTLPRVPMIY